MSIKIIPKVNCKIKVDLKMRVFFPLIRVSKHSFNLSDIN